MTKLVSKKRIVIISILAIISIVAIIFTIRFNYLTGPQSKAPSPVDEWFGIGFERRNLEDSYKNKIITEEEYEKGKAKLIAVEDDIAKKFPRNMIEYKTYRNNDEKHPVEFWIALLSAVFTVIGTVSGIIISWKTDRRAASELEIKWKELDMKRKELEATIKNLNEELAHNKN